ncbi:MAG TPA: isochorismatase family cysteine hydrolase [Xanthobacteraceae bacterium]|nr:isochorismatase family cysteine hydrolase [Xanthobacteraceae bacterium]
MKVLGMRAIGIAVAASALAVAGPASAATIIDEWTNVKPEPAPVLKPVTVDVKATALLVMDMVKGSCNEQRRPRCVASVAPIAKLMDEARAKGVTVINTTAGSGPVADVLPAVAPKPGETVISGTVADKFLHTDIEKMLKEKGLTTVITVGTSAQGAVLYTASAAALRGIKVIAPVDGSSSESLYAEQAVAWLLSHAPGVAQNVTLTSIDQIKF